MVLPLFNLGSGQALLTGCVLPLLESLGDVNEEKSQLALIAMATIANSYPTVTEEELTDRLALELLKFIDNAFVASKYPLFIRETLSIAVDLVLQTKNCTPCVPHPLA